MSTKTNNIREKNRKNKAKVTMVVSSISFEFIIVRYSSSIDRFCLSSRSLFGRNEPFWSCFIVFLVSLFMLSERDQRSASYMKSLIWTISRENDSLFPSKRKSVECVTRRSSRIERLRGSTCLRTILTKISLIVLPIPVHCASIANELKDSSNPLNTFDLHVR